MNTDLTNKVAAVTGAGGVLCSCFAKVLARTGAKVALLDLSYENANKFTEEIVAEGEVTKAYSCNMLDKDICYAVADQVLSALGPCNILLNGAGGNNPRTTADKESFEIGDIEADTSTLSGGEIQRVKLASELHKQGQTYISDEPSTGLHAKDIEKLLGLLRKLVDGGNTVVMVEHRLELIEQADWIIDIAPEGGSAGGEVVFAGTPEEIKKTRVY